MGVFKTETFMTILCKALLLNPRIIFNGFRLMLEKNNTNDSLKKILIKSSKHIFKDKFNNTVLYFLTVYTNMI